MSCNRIMIDFTHEKETSDLKELYPDRDISTFSSHPVNNNGLNNNGLIGGNSNGEGPSKQHLQELIKAAAADGYTKEEIYELAIDVTAAYGYTKKEIYELIKSAIKEIGKEMDR